MATEEDDDDLDPLNDGAPPEADTVAMRMLGVASLLRRLTLEKRKAPAAEYKPLSTWVEDSGLFAAFSDGGSALFDADPGTWDAEEKESVEWAAEELQVLAWALHQAEMPGVFTRADPAPLLAKLPAAGDVEQISLAAKLRPDKEVEQLTALYEPLSNAGRLEAWARAIAADPSQAADDEELAELLEALGTKGSPVEALRQQSRQILADVFAEKSPHAAQAFAPNKLEGLSNEALAVFIATAQLRTEALLWLEEGDAWAVDDDD
jgi:hypothetical protein